MIGIRRGKDRRHVKGDDQDLWLTFDAEDPQDPFAHGFGALELLAENQLPPDTVVPLHPRDDAEIITYVSEGAVAYESLSGNPGVIEAGEFQCVTAGRRLQRNEAIPVRTSGAHIFQLWLRPSKTDFAPGHEKRRFSTAQRRGFLCLIASPDGRQGTLRVHQDAFLYAATLDKGYHLVHALSPGRNAWLHIVRGGVDCAGNVLEGGDAAAVTAEPSVSFTAREETEILLLDLRDQSPVP
jgi:redox-sensitive bicupin YhaK (pirin superfamily)